MQPFYKFLLNIKADQQQYIYNASYKYKFYNDKTNSHYKFTLKHHLLL